MAAAVPTAQRGKGVRLARNLDLLVLAVGLGGGLALAAPQLGLCVGAGAWLAQRLLYRAGQALVRRANQPRRRLGLHLAEAYIRIWLLAGAIVAAGVGGSRKDGLAAATFICGCYTVAFVVKLALGPPERPRRTV